MSRSPRELAVAATLALLAPLAIGGCSSDSDASPDAPNATVVTAKNLSCDQDIDSPDAETTVERVGGLRVNAYSVRFARSTRLGVVALVEGDIPKAFKELNHDFGVTLVAKIDRRGSTAKVVGFEQVDDLVAAACD